MDDVVRDEMPCRTAVPDALPRTGASPPVLLAGGLVLAGLALRRRTA